MCTCFQLAMARPGPGPSAGALPAWLASPLGLAPDPAPARRNAVLEGVELVNPGAGRIRNATVEIRDGRIQRIAPGTLDGPPRAFVLPGLIDMHVHSLPGLTDFFARLELMHGVTTVRNAAAGEDVFDYRDALARGERAGPRLFACGPPLDGKPAAFPAPFGGASLDTPEAGRKMVRRLARRGADHLKVFINLTPPVLAAIREEAAEQGLPVIGHVPRLCRIESAGVGDIQHLTGVPDHPSTAFTVDGAFRPWLEAWQRLDTERLSRVADACLTGGTAHTPTLVQWKGLSRCVDPAVDRPATDGLMPAAYVEGFWNTRRPAGPFTRGLDLRTMRAAREAFPRMLEAVSFLREAGVELLPGTDVINPWVVPGAGLHEELGLLVETGFSPEEALAKATRVAGSRLGVPGLGTLAEGAPADLLLLREDPTRDLAALSTIERVFADGRPYDVAALRARHAPAARRWSGFPARMLARLIGAAASAFTASLPGDRAPQPGH